MYVCIKQQRGVVGGVSAAPAMTFEEVMIQYRVRVCSSGGGGVGGANRPPACYPKKRTFNTGCDLCKKSADPLPARGRRWGECSFSVGA